MTTIQRQNMLERPCEGMPGWRIWRPRRGNRPTGRMTANLTQPREPGRTGTFHPDTGIRLFSPKNTAHPTFPCPGCVATSMSPGITMARAARPPA